MESEFRALMEESNELKKQLSDLRNKANTLSESTQVSNVQMVNIKDLKVGDTFRSLNTNVNCERVLKNNKLAIKNIYGTYLVNPHGYIVCVCKLNKNEIEQSSKSKDFDDSGDSGDSGD